MVSHSRQDVSTHEHSGDVPRAIDPVARRARYSKISSELAHLDDDALGQLLADRPVKQGWGATQTIEIAGEDVFVKLIPLTDLEHERQFSTRNHYGLPTFYQYGVGSAGFGAWRELVTHTTTTNWVLEGTVDTFPLTYHMRVVPRPNWVGPGFPGSIDDYLRKWNSDQGIARYIAERADGRHAALVFVERMPYTMPEWLASKPEDIGLAVRGLCDTVTFLREHGVAHFDAHFNNAVTDGKRFYLVDFGLVLDSRFDLAPNEREFLSGHTFYDLGEVVCSVGALLVWWYSALPEAERASVRDTLGVPDDRKVLYPALVGRVDRLADLVHPTVVEAVVKYRDIIEFMYSFFERLSADPRKDTPFEEKKLRELLRAADVID